jgi:ABC-type nitrate/sulfonate/bicarbonate transport system permease component
VRGTDPAAVALRAVSVAALLAGWEWVGRSKASFAIPTFTQTARAAMDLLGSQPFWEALATSGQSLALGMAGAVAVGIPLGLLMGTLPALGRYLRVYFELMIAIPTAAVIPLVILTVGITVRSSALIVFLFSAPFITINAYAGVRDVSPRLAEMALAFSATPRQFFAKIVVPSSLPMVLVGLRYGLSRAFVGLVVAELLLSPFGVGKLIMDASSMFQYDRLFAAVGLTIIVALALLAALQRIEGRLLHWRRA